MSIENYSKQIQVGVGFGVNAAVPTDARYAVATISEVQQHIENNRVYAGMQFYVADEKALYIFEEQNGELVYKPLLGEVATDSTVVKVSGDQTIAGVKTFSSAPKIGTETATTVEAVAAIKSELEGKIDSKKADFEFSASETIEFGTNEAGEVVASVKAETFDAFGAAAQAKADAIADADGKFEAAAEALEDAVEALEGKIAEKVDIATFGDNFGDSETIDIGVVDGKVVAALINKYDAEGSAATAKSEAIAAAAADAKSKVEAAQAALQAEIDKKQVQLTFVDSETVKLELNEGTAELSASLVHKYDAEGSAAQALADAKADAAEQVAAAKKELTEGAIATAQAAAEAAQGAADAAQAAANVAQGTANQGVANAAAAQAAAEAAQTTANQGVADAATAQAAAEAAQGAADAAQGTADQAVQDAATAQAQADKGVADAAKAQQQADKGVAAAAAAQGTADEGKAAAAKNAEDLGKLAETVADLDAAFKESTEIDDSKASDKSTYSSTKIEAVVSDAVTIAKQEVKNDLLDGAEPAYDTLKELGALFESNKDLIESLDILSKKHVSVSAPEDEGFTVAEKAQARLNIGAAAESDLETVRGLANAAQAQADKGVADAAAAKSEAASALAAAKTELEGKISAAETAAKDAAADELAAAVETLEGAIEAAQGAAGTAASEALAEAKSELEGKISAAETAAKDAAAQDAADKVAALKKELTEGVIADAQKAADDAQDAADAAQGAADAAQGAADAAQGAADAAQGAADAAQAAADVAQGAANTNAQAIEGLDGRIEALEEVNKTHVTLTGTETLSNKTIIGQTATADANGVAIKIQGKVTTTADIVGSGESVLAGFVIDGGEY